MVTWKQRIAAAKKRKEFTIEDLDRASTFDTCAISERPELEARIRIGSTPFILGMDFYRSVRTNDIPKAERVYKAIWKL